MKALLLVLAWSAAACAGAPPFFVFDNGLHGQGLATIGAQLDLVKTTGFDGLSWRSDTPAQLAAVRDGARRRGLQVFAVYVNLDLRGGRLVPDPHVDDVLAVFRNTDTLLWPTLTSAEFRNSDPAGDEVAVAGLRDLAARCASNGLRIAVYPHVGMWLQRVEDAVRVVRKVDRPNVGLTFNLCHALMDGVEDRVPALLAAAAPHLFCVTLNGADSHPPQRGWPQLIQPLGRGSYDVGRVLKELAALGYHGPVGLQCYNIKGDPRVFLPASLAAWRQLNERHAP